MYFQPDPVLRMIEMMGDFLRRLFALPSDEIAADGERRLDELARRLAGMPLSVARGLNAEALMSIAGDPERIWALAEILEASAFVLRAGDFMDEEAARDEAAALELWLRLGASRRMAGKLDLIYAKSAVLKNRGVAADEELWNLMENSMNGQSHSRDS